MPIEPRKQGTSTQYIQPSINCDGSHNLVRSNKIVTAQKLGAIRTRWVRETRSCGQNNKMPRLLHKKLMRKKGTETQKMHSQPYLFWGFCGKEAPIQMPRGYTEQINDTGEKNQELFNWPTPPPNQPPKPGPPLVVLDEGGEEKIKVVKAQLSGPSATREIHHHGRVSLAKRSKLTANPQAQNCSYLISSRVFKFDLSRPARSKASKASSRNQVETEA